MDYRQQSYAANRTANVGTGTYKIRSVQSGIKQFNRSNIQNYSFFLGGVASKNRDLQNLDPQKTGYNRIFITRMPEFMKYIMPDQTKWFKHILETMFTEITGLADATMEFVPLAGGVNGNEIQIPTILKDSTDEITITVPEQSGSVVREFISTWLYGIADRISGYSRYCGILDSKENNTGNLTYAQCNHTMEAIYIATDPTGLAENIEFACLLTNMVPKTVKESCFNYRSGNIEINLYEIPFTCNKYVSADINDRAKELLTKYSVVLNSINQTSGYTSTDVAEMTAWNLTE